MLWIYISDYDKYCWSISSKCMTNASPESEQAMKGLNLAYHLSMWGNLICFALHYTI